MEVSLVASMQTQSGTFITPQAAATASGLLGFDATSLAHLDLGISCRYSLQILSSVVMLVGDIFTSLQRSGQGSGWTIVSLSCLVQFEVLTIILCSIQCPLEGGFEPSTLPRSSRPLGL